MADKHRLALHATLPPRYARFEVLAATIDYRGRLLALLVDPAHVPVGAGPIPPYDAILVICDGDDSAQIQLNDLDQRFSEIDAFGDGVVLAAARIDTVTSTSSELPRNVVAFDSTGHRVGGFYAGDAIAQLLTDPAGRIWISYFDEATFAFPQSNGTWEIGFLIGAARWDSLDSPAWFAFDDTGSQVSWCDCYAINVGRNRTYACPYPEFAVVEMDSDGVLSINQNLITRCTGLVVSGSSFGFFEQHDEPESRWVIRRGRLQDGVITETTQAELLLPDGHQPRQWARGRIGRDATLWLHEADNPRQWYRYDLEG
ncbi:hypothetical protein ACFVMC_13045 [Nocardia sp. NPDC127579]|uniref:hypothetical protein n=1 Tax=Nocardia sp. NPDC127579 TaxID=3345402 RepID=UPI003634F2E9